MTIFNYGMQLWSLKSLDLVFSYSFGRKNGWFYSKISLRCGERNQGIGLSNFGVTPGSRKLGITPKNHNLWGDLCFATGVSDFIDDFKKSSTSTRELFTKQQRRSPNSTLKTGPSLSDTILSHCRDQLTTTLRLLRQL